VEDARGNRLLARNARAAPGGLLFLLPLSTKRLAVAPEAGLKRPLIREDLNVISTSVPGG